MVVLLHGRGADGADLCHIVPVLARMLPHAAFVAPDASYPCHAAPYGREWFMVRSHERDPDEIEAGVRSAAPALDCFIDAELAAHGLGDDRLALFGFSQAA